MPFITVPEFYTTRLYELDDEVYRLIEHAFVKAPGKHGRAFLYQHLDLTVAQLSTNTCVNIMGLFKIL